MSADAAASSREPATLDPIVYEPVIGEDGTRTGWRVPDHERRRWTHGSGLEGTGRRSFAPLPPDLPEPRGFDELLAELDAWGIGDHRLYEQLEALYQREPLIADRISAAAVTGAQSGSLRDPSAYLASRLRPRRK